MNIRHTNRKRTIHKVIAKILLIALVFPVVTSILPMQVQAYGNNNIVPFATYYEFRDAVLGTEHDINGDYNYQCWDGAALLWHQLGKTLFTERRLYGEGFSPGAKTCWNLREVNKYEDFILIENKEDILQGDVLVFGFGQWGHICFADEDYREGMTEIRCLGQNQINSNDFPGHAFDAQTKINLNGFLGAFRYKGWHGYGNNDWMCWVESMGSNVTSAFAGKKVRLRSAESGKYVCGENNSTVHADGTCGIGEYQTYLTPDGWIGFKLEDGNWLSVQENNYIRTTATDLQSWECFKIFLYEGYYYIISQKNLCYIQVTNEQARPLRATRSNEQGLYGATWERFRIEVVYDGTEVGLGGGNEDIPSYVSCEYWGSDYNEGWYEGQWKNGRPNGFGKLIYTDFADGKYYSLNYSDGSQAIASFYEGCFVDGARVGSGKVVYDNGWWEEGTYYGTYQPGKVVFEGKLWKENKGYWPTTLTATSSTSGSYSFGPYCPVQQLSVSSNIEGRYYCVIPQDFKLMLYESVTDETAKWYYPKRDNSYEIVCTHKYVMSDGTVRYSFALSGSTYYFNQSSEITVISVDASDVSITNFAVEPYRYYDGVSVGIIISWNSSINTDAPILFCPYVEELDNNGNVINSYFYNDGKESGWVYGFADTNKVYRVTLYAMISGHHHDKSESICKSETLSIIIPDNVLSLTAEASPEDYPNAVRLDWTLKGTDVLKVYRIDISKQLTELIYTTDFSDNIADNCMYNHPDHDGKYQYYVYDTRTNEKSNYATVYFEITGNGSTLAQKEYVKKANISVSDSGRLDNALYIEWEQDESHVLKLYRVNPNGKSELIHTTDPSDDTWDGGIYDYPVETGLYEYFLEDSTDGFTTKGSMYYFLLRNGESMTAKQLSSVVYSQFGNEIVCTYHLDEPYPTLAWYTDGGSYTIQRRDGWNEEKPWATLSTGCRNETGNNKISFTDTTANSFTEYTYRILSENGTSQSPEIKLFTQACEEYSISDMSVIAEETCQFDGVIVTGGEIQWSLLSETNDSVKIIALQSVNGSVTDIRVQVIDRQDVLFAPFAFEEIDNADYCLYCINSNSGIVYDKWSSSNDAAEDTIFFDANRGVSEIRTIRVAVGDRYGFLPTPQRTGYTFSGWYTADGERRITENDIHTEQDNQVFIATWIRDQYTVTINGNGGFWDDDFGFYDSISVESAYGMCYGTLPKPFKPGYDFAGFYSRPNGGIRVTGASVVQYAKDHTLYAHWEPLTKTLKFDPNGGYMRIGEIQAAYDDIFTNLPTPNRDDNYQFDGWYTVFGVKVRYPFYMSDHWIFDSYALTAKWNSPEEAGAGSGVNSEQTAQCNHALKKIPEKSASCTTDGNTTYWKCSRCGRLFSDGNGDHETYNSAVIIKAFGHQFKRSITFPTCTENGYSTYSCSKCGDSYVIDEDTALGHDYIEEVTAPTCGKGGFTTISCSRCYYTEKSCEVPMTDHTWGEQETIVRSAEVGVEIKEFFCSKCNAKKLEVSTLGNPFTDVKEGKYYYSPVLWAYYHEPRITSGASETTFGPKDTCTRAQIVTFLWHAMGDPEPVSIESPFTDVKSNKYYYKPVLWAVENGITSGVGEGKFGVKQPCTRAQAMTFLWIAVGKPEPTIEENPFPNDVKPNKYYYKPILWAVENGITTGIGEEKFGVSQPCTRAQIVTFLYKALTNR